MSPINYRQKESYKLDFKNMINDQSAGINVRKLKKGSIISIPSIELALSMTCCPCGCLTAKNDNDMITVVFFEVVKSKPWIREYYQDDFSTDFFMPVGKNGYPTKDSTLVHVKVYSTLGHLAEIYLGTIEDDLPSDITDSIFFLPGAKILLK